MRLDLGRPCEGTRPRCRRRKRRSTRASALRTAARSRAGTSSVRSSRDRRADVPLTLRYVVADVFTDTALTGNQLAVFTDGREIDDETMQLLAREMNLSETVFVLPPEAGGHARIRIFTPASELPFAGTRRSARRSSSRRRFSSREIRLETGAGAVPVRLEREGARISSAGWTQPLPPWRTYERADELLAALGVESELPVELVRPRPLVRVRRAALAGRGRVAAAGLQRPRATSTRASTASPSATAAGSRACSRRAAESRRIPRRARRPGRSPCTCSSRLDRRRRRDRDRAGRRAEASVTAVRARLRHVRRRSSASRSAAARWSSRAASSACRDFAGRGPGPVPGMPSVRECLDRRSSHESRMSGQSGRAARSSDAGLARTRRRSSRRAGGCGTRRRSDPGCPRDRVTAVPGGSPPPVSRQVMPASCETTSGGLRSTTATIVEPAAADATTRGRERSQRLRATNFDGARRFDLLRVEVDLEGAVLGLDDGLHRSIAATTAVARRAAGTGACPEARAAR